MILWYFVPFNISSFWPITLRQFLPLLFSPSYLLHFPIFFSQFDFYRSDSFLGFFCVVFSTPSVLMEETSVNLPVSLVSFVWGEWLLAPFKKKGPRHAPLPLGSKRSIHIDFSHSTHPFYMFFALCLVAPPSAKSAFIGSALYAVLSFFFWATTRTSPTAAPQPRILGSLPFWDNPSFLSQTELIARSPWNFPSNYFFPYFDRKGTVLYIDHNFVPSYSAVLHRWFSQNTGAYISKSGFPARYPLRPPRSPPHYLEALLDASHVVIPPSATWIMCGAAASHFFDPRCQACPIFFFFPRTLLFDRNTSHFPNPSRVLLVFLISLVTCSFLSMNFLRLESHTLTLRPTNLIKPEYPSPRKRCPTLLFP